MHKTLFSLWLVAVFIFGLGILFLGRVITSQFGTLSYWGIFWMIFSCSVAISRWRGYFNDYVEAIFLLSSISFMSLVIFGVLALIIFNPLS